MKASTWLIILLILACSSCTTIGEKQFGADDTSLSAQICVATSKNEPDVPRDTTIAELAQPPSPILQADYYQEASASYNVQSAVYLENAIQIDYPKVDGMTDYALQDRINTKLMVAFIGAYLNSWEWEGLDVTASFEIMRQDDAILSVISVGDPYVDGTNHPTRFVFAVNIDMRTGALLAFDDVASFAALRQNFADFQLVSDVNLDNLDGIDKAGDYYEQASFLYFDSRHRHDYYIIEDRVGILVRVPHPFGDVAIFEQR